MSAPLDRPEVRPGRPRDGVGCARVRLDTARYYVGLDPETFRLPAEEGLAEWFDGLPASAPPDACRLGAELWRRGGRPGRSRHGVIYRKTQGRTNS